MAGVDWKPAWILGFSDVSFLYTNKVTRSIIIKVTNESYPFALIILSNEVEVSTLGFHLFAIVSSGSTD
jgi:hypothetical protein